MSNKPIDSVQAWEAFCEQLKAAGSILERETTPRDDLTQAEGLRKLVRMIRMGFEASLEYGNTDYPEVYQLVTPTTLGEGETSDSHYYQTMIDGAKSYRISGDRGEAPGARQREAGEGAAEAADQGDAAGAARLLRARVRAVRLPAGALQRDEQPPPRDRRGGRSAPRDRPGPRPRSAGRPRRSPARRPAHSRRGRARRRHCADRP